MKLGKKHIHFILQYEEFSPFHATFAKYASTAAGITDALPDTKFSYEDIDMLLDITSDVLTKYGVTNGELNAAGYEAEALIDVLSDAFYSR